MTFELGVPVMTAGIRQAIAEKPDALNAFTECIHRHSVEDWGDLCDEDKQMNDDALEAERKGEQTDRLFSAYDTDFGKVYVITEWDRSVTTILFPEEY